MHILVHVSPHRYVWWYSIFYQGGRSLDPLVDPRISGAQAADGKGGPWLFFPEDSQGGDLTWLPSQSSPVSFCRHWQLPPQENSPPVNNVVNNPHPQLCHWCDTWSWWLMSGRLKLICWKLKRDIDWTMQNWGCGSASDCPGQAPDSTHHVAIAWSDHLQVVNCSARSPLGSSFQRSQWSAWGDVKPTKIPLSWNSKGIIFCVYSLGDTWGPPIQIFV